VGLEDHGDELGHRYGRGSRRAPLPVCYQFPVNKRPSGQQREALNVDRRVGARLVLGLESRPAGHVVASLNHPAVQPTQLLGNLVLLVDANGIMPGRVQAVPWNLGVNYIRQANSVVVATVPGHDSRARNAGVVPHEDEHRRLLVHGNGLGVTRNAKDVLGLAVDADVDDAVVSPPVHLTYGDLARVAEQLLGKGEGLYLES